MTAEESYEMAERPELELASLGDRLLAQIIDGFIAFVPLMAAVFVLAESDVVGGVAVPVAGAFALFYLWFADGFSNGQSWGKRVFNTAVVSSETGEPCSFGQSFVRNILLSVLGPVDWIFILGSSRRRLGDHAAGTEVIELPKQI
jgi:uncharacterized RDD family membrane protein YckC